MRDLDDAAVAALLDMPDPARGANAVAGGHGSDADLVEAFVLAAADLDSPRLERVLDEMFVQGSFESVAEPYLVPALRRMGDAWASGSLDVAADHAASHAVSRRLGMAYQACARPLQEREVVMVGLPRRDCARSSLGPTPLLVTGSPQRQAFRAMRVVDR